MKRTYLATIVASFLSCLISLFFPFYITASTIKNGVFSYYGQSGFLASFGASWEAYGSNRPFSCYSPFLTVAFLLFLLAFALDVLYFLFFYRREIAIASQILSPIFKVVSIALFFAFPFYVDATMEIGVATACVVFGFLLFLSAILTVIEEILLRRKGHL